MSLFKTRFLWNGKKKVTILSAINSHEEGGLTIIDIESTIRVLSRSKTCLENIKRVQFTSNKCAWKLYLKHLYLKMWFSCYTVAGIITKLMTFRFNHCSIVKKYFRRHLQQMRTGWRLIIALLTYLRVSRQNSFRLLVFIFHSRSWFYFTHWFFSTFVSF